MAAEHLEVRRGTDTLAVLGRHGQGLRCTYTDAALDRSPLGSLVLSCSLPLARRPFDATAWARGLLPEGQHLNALAGIADVAPSDTFGLLARFGRDLAGAFEITPPEPPPRTPSVEPLDADALEREVAELDGRPLGIHDDSELSLAGLQDKLLLVREGVGAGWARPRHGYPSTHILKIEPDRFAGLVAAEAACLRLARTVGLTTVGAQTAELAERRVLIVSRFDRTIPSDGPPIRTHQEDLLQALGIDPRHHNGRAKYQRAGTPGPPSWWHAADLLDSFAVDAPAQLEQLLRAMVFTTVIGNADCHAKNIAFELETGRIRLAPLYDTVPTALWPRLRAAAAMTVNDSADMTEITVDDLVAEARRWRLPAAGASRTVVATIEECTAAAPVTDHDEVAALVTANAARLLDGHVRTSG